ncbi:acetate--CoA ligase, partial [uncultured Aquimonas sp.]|uniref:acetate--CoA ligase n=1 Tax=uncultured Aquimonas sp. TaxID=385483 RepID=UPI00263436A4
MSNEAASGPIYAASDAFSANARYRRDDYERLYRESVDDNEGFWGRMAERLEWFKAPTKIKDVSYRAEDLHIRWFEDGELNLSVNCLDRHLATRGDKTAILWEGDSPEESAHVSYRDLHARVCKLANALRNLGVKRGDRVTLYLPMIPEAAVAMLACARIGAVHSIVFGGFSPDALSGRIADCGSKIVITSDESMRGGKHVPLKANVDAALKHPETSCVETVIVVRRTGGAIDMQSPRDRWYDVLVEGQPDTCEPERMNAEDPLFILYTSGSTGKPKGVLHTTGGYLLYASLTHEAIFDVREDDVFWCTADVGWVTGHSYVVYGPLANGATSLMFEGVPNYPSVSRFWDVCDKHKVTLFYTAPTAIRALMREGEEPVKRTSRASLRLLGSVGEPINPEAWEWYYRVVGDSRCPIVDTWWQTETGGILITPLPGAIAQKPGSATLPFFGVRPAIVDGEGKVLEGATEGNLVLLDSWPGQMRTVYGDHQRFID